jgi:hypothetical protein
MVRSMGRTTVTGAAWLMAMLVASPAQAALEYTFVDLGTGPPGFQTASITAVSEGQLGGGACSGHLPAPPP